MMALERDFERPIEDAAIAVDQLLQRIAQGLDILPRLKVGDSNSENHATHD